MEPLNDKLLSSNKLSEINYPTYQELGLARRFSKLRIHEKVDLPYFRWNLTSTRQECCRHKKASTVDTYR